MVYQIVTSLMLFIKNHKITGAVIILWVVEANNYLLDLFDKFVYDLNGLSNCDAVCSLQFVWKTTGTVFFKWVQI